MFKKSLLILLGLASIALTGCTQAPKEEPIINLVSGRYYTNGTVITNDGNEWNYSQDIISEAPSYDNEPVIAAIDDKGTPENIKDDEILGLVLDRETAIYDELEASLSQSFEVERDGNIIKISTNK